MRNIWGSQVARFSVALSAGTAYEFKTSDFAPADGDTVMHLLDWNNVEVQQNDDAAPGQYWSYIPSYTPPASGTYYIIVRSYSSHSETVGRVQWRQKPGSVWGAWTYVGLDNLFGGNVVSVQPDQAEYWLARATPSYGSLKDSVIYGMHFDSATWVEKIVGFDDDGGVGHMSRWVKPSSTSVDMMLVGSYDYLGGGSVDLLANDKTPDVDGDGLGALLESELGTCDNLCVSCVPAYCADGTIFNAKDTDHDGLGDKDEAIGVDWPADKSKALHLWSWGANPLRKDAFIEQDWVPLPTCPTGSPRCWDSSITSNPFTQSMALDVNSKFAVATQAELHNPVAGDGVALHFDTATFGDPCPTYPSLCGAWGGGGENTAAGMHASRTGVFRHLLIWPNGGQTVGVYVEAGIGTGPTFAPPKTVVHELGHGLGLAHDGTMSFTDVPSPPKPANAKANYDSLMNYTYDTDWSAYAFSRGPKTSILDPARMSESTSYAGFNAERLQKGYSGPLGSPTTLNFPIATADGKVDWNRDGILVDTEASWIRGVFPVGADQAGTDWALADEVTPLTDTGNVSPDLAPFVAGDGTKRLYAFYADPTRTSIIHRGSLHTGNSDRGACSNGTGHFLTSCHTFGSPYVTRTATAGTTITSVVALPWPGPSAPRLVVAWRTIDSSGVSKIWVNAASAANPSGGSDPGRLTGWGIDTLVATDSSSADIELAPMYVKTTAPGSYPASEVLAIFYTAGMGASAIHRMAFTTDPLSAAWQTRDVKLVGASSALPGQEAPGVAVWPSRSSVFGSPTYSSYGYACGYFPGTTAADMTRLAKFLCYDKNLDRWRDLTVGVVGGTDTHNEGKRPGMAFHMLRAAAPDAAAPDTQVAPLDEANGKGVFIMVPITGAGEAWVFSSTYVSQSHPPFDPVTGNAQFTFNFIEHSWGQDGGRSLALYADRDLSAVKAFGFAVHEDVVHPELGGIFDGAHHARLRDANDFKIMEESICRTIKDPAYCGSTGYWGFAYP